MGSVVDADAVSTSSSVKAGRQKMRSSLATAIARGTTVTTSVQTATEVKEGFEQAASEVSLEKSLEKRKMSLAVPKKIVMRNRRHLIPTLEAVPKTK